MSKKNGKQNVNDEKTIIKQNIDIVHKFNDDELQELGQEISQEIQEKTELENEKKSVVSSYKARIEAKDTTIHLLANKISTKQEDRSVECAIHMNTPRVGRKTAYRTDNEEVVWERPMDPEDMQLRLNMEIDGSSMVAHSEVDDNRF